eukprot:365535-Chlamydomonas_euryale.AAC.75
MDGTMSAGVLVTVDGCGCGSGGDAERQGKGRHRALPRSALTVDLGCSGREVLQQQLVERPPWQHQVAL